MKSAPWRNLAAITALNLVAAAGLVLPSCEGATVGGTPVPDDLHCEEDEVIGFHGVPDDLACLHYGTLEVAE
jgi:hypothetical protein